MNALVGDGAPGNVEDLGRHRRQRLRRRSATRRPGGLFRSGNGGGSWTSLDLPVADHPPGRPGEHPPLARRLARQPERRLHRRRPAEHAVPQRRRRRRLLGPAVPDRRLAARPAARPSTSRTRTRWARPGGGTANNSAPHADSRVMVMRRERRGHRGRRRRGLPADHPRQQHGHLASRSSATWWAPSSHGIAFDTNTNTVFGGSQDNGHAAAAGRRTTRCGRASAPRTAAT